MLLLVKEVTNNNKKKHFQEEYTGDVGAEKQRKIILESLFKSQMYSSHQTKENTKSKVYRAHYTFTIMFTSTLLLSLLGYMAASGRARV